MSRVRRAADAKKKCLPVPRLVRVRETSYRWGGSARAGVPPSARKHTVEACGLQNVFAGGAGAVSWENGRGNGRAYLERSSDMVVAAKGRGVGRRCNEQPGIGGRSKATSLALGNSLAFPQARVSSVLY